MDNTAVLIEMAAAMRQIVDVLREQQRILTRLVDASDPRAVLVCDVCATVWPRLEGPTCPNCRDAEDEPCPAG